MSTDIAFARRLTAAVPEDIATAVQTAAAARGLTVADYLRGSVQARLMLDGAPFRPLPNLHRLALSAGRPAASR